MYLKRLELKGFKTFANKTDLEFLAPRQNSRGITAIVGPNGSGKSNLADSIRWVLGEQSLKVLRGKKSEDVIFSGTDKRGASGFAEVSLLLVNEGTVPDIPYEEINVTRRIYRDSTSEYLLNNTKCRLTDVHLLMAKANVGHRTYAVIGQGMIDEILTLSPEERRDFFAEATGVKQFEIKKHQAENKIAATEENLKHVEMLLAEIEPTARALARQVKKLEERASLEKELHELEHLYYGNLWRELSSRFESERRKLEGANKELQEYETKASTLRKKLESLEKEESGTERGAELNREYRELLEREMDIKNELWRRSQEVARQKNASKKEWVTIQPQLLVLLKEHGALLEVMKAAKSPEGIKNAIEKLEMLHLKITTVVEDQDEKPDTKMKDLEHELATVTTRLGAVKIEITALQTEEAQSKKNFFEIERELRAMGDMLARSREGMSSIQIEHARTETRREALKAEIQEMLKDRASKTIEQSNDVEQADTQALQPRIHKLRYQLEMIGSIDPEVVKEHQATHERYEFLMAQTGDLRASIKNLEAAAHELDDLIEQQFKEVFKKINHDFGRFFEMLFGGGAAKLTLQEQEVTEEEQEDAELHEEKKPEGKKMVVEMHASPPGKKVRSLTALSGGEKALTAISLICAILSNNPSPFVVLDEVDAALDESNSIRFANILEELSKRSQFVVITHNRATMEKAITLYGVTGGDDGTSRMLSVNLAEAEEIAE